MQPAYSVEIEKQMQVVFDRLSEKECIHLSRDSSFAERSRSEQKLGFWLRLRSASGLVEYRIVTQRLCRLNFCRLSRLKWIAEKDKRLYAGVEALKFPYGGISYIAQLFSCSRNTIRRGINELKEKATIPKKRIEKRAVVENKLLKNKRILMTCFCLF